MSQRGLFYGWVVLAAAATVVAIGQGSLFALGVFLKPLEDSMRWSRSAISMTALINWMAMGAGSFFWGVLSDRVGSRAVTVAGGSLLGLGLVLSGQATALWQLHVTFGLGVGFAAGAFLTPLSAGGHDAHGETAVGREPLRRRGHRVRRRRGRHAR